MRKGQGSRLFLVYVERLQQPRINPSLHRMNIYAEACRYLRNSQILAVAPQLRAFDMRLDPFIAAVKARHHQLPVDVGNRMADVPDDDQGLFRRPAIALAPAIEAQLRGPARQRGAGITDLLGVFG